MSAAHTAPPRDVRILGLRPHARLMSEVVIFAVLSLGGAALAIAGARIVARNANVAAVVNVGWGMVAVGALVAAATATLGVLRVKQRARIEDCTSGCVLRTFPAVGMTSGGAVFARLPDGSRQRWRLDSRRPLLILGDPPLLLGVTTPGRDGAPIGVAEDGYPFADTPALADLLAAARELGATVVDDANVGGASRATGADAAPDDHPGNGAADSPRADEFARAARAALPLSRHPNTVIARRLRRTTLLLVLVIAVMTLLVVAKRDFTVGSLTATAVIVLGTVLWVRPRLRGMSGTVTVAESGITVSSLASATVVPWDRVPAITIRAVSAGRAALTVDVASAAAALPGMLADHAAADGAADSPALADDPLVRRLVALGMGVAPVLPDVRILVSGPPRRIRLPGTHDWHLAHALAAEALARGIDVEFG